MPIWLLPGDTKMLMTKKVIAELPEARLRKEVLIPLFEAMGYQDVYETHGSHELGKDIVMWQKDLVKERINYAVVVKATKVSGSTKNVAEVCTQVRQCFGRVYVDPVSLKDQRVDFVIVITSGAVTSEAREAIKADLEGSGVFDRVDIIDGETLLRRIRQYLPKALLWDALDQASHALGELNNDFRYTLQVESDGVTNVLVAPKDDLSKVVEGSLKLRFPETIEGIAKRAEFNHHLKTGKPIEFTEEFIGGIDMPEFLGHLHSEGKITNLYMGATRVHPPMLMRLEATGANGLRFVLDYVDFTHQHGGKEEVTFDNSGQPIPIRFEFTMIKSESGKANLRWHIDPDDANVMQQFRVLCLAKVLGNGGEIRMVDWVTGLPIFRLTLNPGAIQEPSDLELEAFEKLLMVQAKIGKVLKAGFLTYQDAENISFAYAATHYGIFKSESAVFAEGNLPFPTDWAWRDKVGQSVSLAVTVENMSVIILGQSIALGRSDTLYQGIVTKEDVDVGDGPDREPVIMLRANAEYPFLCAFPEWLAKKSQGKGENSPSDQEQNEGKVDE